MKKITYFDVEYANPKNKSICQIGIDCLNFADGEPYYPELDIYIDPEDEFSDMCVKVHGITKEKVKGAKTFPAIWNEIEKYFVNAVVVGHNVAASDLDALYKNLKRYALDIPEFYYIDTLEVAKQFIPRYAVADYKLSTLCKHMNVDIDNEHNAFDDACACEDLFRALIAAYNFHPDKYVTKFVPHDVEKFTAFIQDSVLRKDISEFYGMLRGFSIDGVISGSETATIKAWRDKYFKYYSQQEIKNIIDVIDNVLKDGVITNDEIISLQAVIKSYLDIISTSPITLATQILDGILKGIIADGNVTEIECKNLRQWLYDNIYLSDHYPFNRAMEMLDKILSDSIVTAEESKYLTSIIDDLLNPVKALKAQVFSVDGKHVCLTGNFAFGQKSAVEKYLTERGGIIDNGVTKATNILIVGDCECQAYSNGTYGTKIKKALEYRQKGCAIDIIKETDFFSQVS